MISWTVIFGTSVIRSTTLVLGTSTLLNIAEHHLLLFHNLGDLNNLLHSLRNEVLDNLLHVDNLFHGLRNWNVDHLLNVTLLCDYPGNLHNFFNSLRHWNL